MEKSATLRATESFAGVEVNMREIVDSWILITYDLPNTDEGQKMRAQFLKKAERLGAVIHTESVYLLPNCPESELLAVNLASVGKMYLWVSQIKDPNRAQELTDDYDAKVEAGLIKEVRQRIAVMQDRAQSNPSAFERMKKKTYTLLDESSGIALRRGSTRLVEAVAKLREDVDAIVPASGSVSGWANELKGLL